MLDVSKKPKNHMMCYVISAEIFSKKCANNFFWKINNYFNGITIIYKTNIKKNWWFSSKSKDKFYL